MSATFNAIEIEHPLLISGVNNSFSKMQATPLFHMAFLKQKPTKDFGLKKINLETRVSMDFNHFFSVFLKIKWGQITIN